MAFLFVLVGCKGRQQNDSLVHFAVLSDIHLYDAATDNHDSASESGRHRERKVRLESGEIFAEAASSLLSMKPALDFILITGDLTKDGERRNHRLVASRLAIFKEAGIKVFVVPGNHDVLNPNAAGYADDGKLSVFNISPDEFVETYSAFGYSQAISRAPDTLSYIAEPVPGLWIMALDSCRYEENVDGPIVAGALSPATMSWALTRLDQAKELGKIVIGIMHHGLLENFFGQAAYFPDFLVEGWQDVSEAMAEHGLRVMFTGHFHAQDISRKDWNDGMFLFDIETASLAEFPCAYRLANLSLSTGSLSLDRKQVGGENFKDFAAQYRQGQVAKMAVDLAISSYKLDSATALDFSPAIVDAFMAHFDGDEIPSLTTFKKVAQLVKSEDPVRNKLGQFLFSLWHDLPPADNRVILDLFNQTTDKTALSKSVVGPVNN